MHSLFDVLLTQHGRQLAPVRCAYSTVLQLHRYFEDVVLENNLSALVVESLPLSTTRTARERTRIRELAQGDRHTFLFAHQADGLNELVKSLHVMSEAAPVFIPHGEDTRGNEHFIVIADARFSALLATVRGRGKNNRIGGDEVFWTFEPDIVYSALEYLMARLSAEHPEHSSTFGNAVRSSMPKATSLQLTVSVTTKLAHLLQEQAGREVAVNRIATAIRESLNLPAILQKTVDEVGVALNVQNCALRVEGSNAEQALTHFHFDDQVPAAERQNEQLVSDLEQYCRQFAEQPEVIVRDSDDELGPSAGGYPFAVVPLVFDGRMMGALQVTAADRGRLWHENEILLLRTVADQVAVAVNQAKLFAQIQQQALTDSLTGCYNRRSFEMYLDKDLFMAKRLHQPVSLLMLDLDRFKHLNDTAGHDAGDEALRMLAGVFREELRNVDTAARFGGDEFVLILPQAYADGAVIVAERLRSRIEQLHIPNYGRITTSIGIATFPIHAGSRAELLRAADEALYSAKRGGRNRVCVAEVSQIHTSSVPNVETKSDEKPNSSVDMVM
jgi:diguanylate cyclase (GGDEF)-like protein